MNHIPANRRCTRCKPKKPCLNHEADHKAALYLGRIRRKASLAAAAIPLENRGF